MARPRKDLMKPKPIVIGEQVKSEGGLAHSLDKKNEEAWGGKKPPYPRSELNRTKASVRSGMALTK